MPAKLNVQFPGLAEAAGFAAILPTGFVIDTNRCTITAWLSEAELETAICRFRGKRVAGQ